MSAQRPAGQSRLKGRLDDERVGRISARFSPGIGTPPNASLCARTVELLSVDGAGISLMSGRNSGPVCSSSPRVSHLEDLQFSLGEGPCHDAFTTATTIVEPDLTTGPVGRWPTYTQPALDLGACAVFAFPLEIGSGIVGVLTLYNDTVGMLSEEQAADARALARMLPGLMAAIQSDSPEALLSTDLSDFDAHRAEIHQASGVTAVQLGIGVDGALALIRAHAYVTGDTVAHVAGEVLAHRVHLGDDGLSEREPRHDESG